MATAKANFLNRSWDQRSGGEKTLIVGGTILGTLWIAKQVKKLFEPGLGYYTQPGTGAGIHPATDYLSPTGTPQGVSIDPRPMVDEIAQEVIGYNYSYEPDIINRLTELSPDELKISYNYWNSKYRTSAGGTLTQALEGEWASATPWSESYYAPAINYLKQNGLY